MLLEIFFPTLTGGLTDGLLGKSNQRVSGFSVGFWGNRWRKPWGVWGNSLANLLWGPLWSALIWLHLLGAWLVYSVQDYYHIVLRHTRMIYPPGAKPCWYDYVLLLVIQTQDAPICTMKSNYFLFDIRFWQGLLPHSCCRFCHQQLLYGSKLVWTHWHFQFSWMKITKDTLQGTSPYPILGKGI